MKRYIIIMYTALLLSGCGRQTAGWQTGDVALVRAVGVDVAPSGVALTAWGGDIECPIVLKAEGVSIADGVRALQRRGDRFVHVGHANQLLLGEAFVRDGTAQLLDFVARDRQIGPGARLWVLREDGVLADVPDVAARLERLAKDGVVDCSGTRLMRAMAENGSVAVPALCWEENGLQPAGYAVLRQGRLVGFLDGAQSLGLELLCGEHAGQMLEVELPDGARIVLSVKNAAFRYEPQTEAGRMVGATVHSSIGLVPRQGPSLTDEQRQAVARLAEGVLCRRLAAVLACAQFWDADFTGVEQRLRGACSAQEWGAVDWDRDFRALPMQVAASVQISWPADMVEE